MTGPSLVLAGIVGGVLTLLLLEYGRNKCKTDWCVTYVILGIVMVIMLSLLFAVVG
jgi:hypothetical protein